MRQNCAACGALLHRSCVCLACSTQQLQPADDTPTPVAVTSTKKTNYRKGARKRQPQPENEDDDPASVAAVQEEIVLTQRLAPREEGERADALNVLDLSIEDITKYILSHRPRIHSTIPLELVPIWNQLMNTIALKAIAEPKYELIWLGAPLFFLTKKDLARSLAFGVQSVKVDCVPIPEEDGVAPSLDTVEDTVQRAERCLRHNVSKAIRVLRNPLQAVSMSDSELLAALRKKILNDDTTDLSTVSRPGKTSIQPAGLLMTPSFRKMRNGIAPGTGLLTTGHLRVLAPGPATGLLQRMTVEIATGCVAEHLRPILYGDPGRALPKGDGGVRPICMGHTIVKLALRQLMSQLKSSNQLVGPTQYGFGMPHGPQRCAAKLQQALDEGLAVVKTDISNAFNTVNRAKLAAMLFDVPGAKALYKYFIDRYLRPSLVHVYNSGNSYIGSVEQNVGLCQGDVLAPLLFDIFVSDASEHLGLSETLQIHDDLYVICDPSRLEETIEKIKAYASRKQLALNPQKTKVMGSTLTSHPNFCASSLVGGIPISVNKDIPVDISRLVSVPHFEKLRLQTQLGIFQCLKQSWRYTLEAAPKSLTSQFASDIRQMQQEMLERLLAPADGDISRVTKEQLFERPQYGGLGFFDPAAVVSIFDEKGQYIVRKKADREAKPKPSAWYTSLDKGVQAGFNLPFPLVTCLPVDKVLRLSDFNVSAYIVTLLNCWKPAPFFCRIENATRNLPSSESLYHHLVCQSCSGALRTYRHTLLTEAISAVLRRHGAVTQLEPQGWPLRTKPSNMGHDGPDMLVTWGTSTYWLDMFVTNTHPHKSAYERIQHACHIKHATYAPARAEGIDVLPVGFSHLGAPIGPQNFLSVVKSNSKQAFREIHNLVGVRAAIALGLYLQKALVSRARLSIVSSSIPQQNQQAQQTDLIISACTEEH